ncbi:MAG: hypothetical protein ACYC2H_00085 [Thermoplasmatota archaeon]
MRVNVYEEGRRKNGHDGWRTRYKVAVTSVRSSTAFAQRIGFFGKRKATILANLLKQPPPQSSRRFSIRHRELLEDLWLYAKGLPDVRAEINARRRWGVFNLDWLRRLVDAHPLLGGCKAARLLIDGVTYEAIEEIEPVADAEWVAFSTSNGEPIHAEAFVLSTDRGG